MIAFDQRLSEVDRVGGDGDMGQMIPVPDEVFRERHQVAGRNTVAAMPALLDMCGADRQSIPFPFSGGKTHPGVNGVVGRVWTAIHVNGAVLLIGADVFAQRDDILRLRIALLPNSNSEGPAMYIPDGVNLALMLLKRKAVGIPAKCPLPRGIVNG